MAKSPIRDGWIARTHYTDAAACLWLEGELVHLEDLVLHDAGMDIRTPTHELTRARAVLRTRRRIAAAKADWALSTAGLAGLRGRGGQDDREKARGDKRDDAEFDDDDEAGADDQPGLIETDERLAGAFAAVDAAMVRAEQTLAGESRRPGERDPLVYDPDWDEDARIEDWRRVVDQTRSWPPALAAAIAADAWDRIEPLLRGRGKTRTHLACLHAGLKTIPRERRRPLDPAARLMIQLEAIAAAAEAGLRIMIAGLTSAHCSPASWRADAPPPGCRRCSTTS